MLTDQLETFFAVHGVNLSLPIVGSHRPTFLYLRAGCTDDPKRSSSIRQRFHAIQAFTNISSDVEVGVPNEVGEGWFASNMPTLGRMWEIMLSDEPCPMLQVGCTCSNCQGSKQHSELLASYGKSLFCITIGGDCLSSVRLTETMLAGCLPPPSSA